MTQSGADDVVVALSRLAAKPQAPAVTFADNGVVKFYLLEVRTVPLPDPIDPVAAARDFRVINDSDVQMRFDAIVPRQIRELFASGVAAIDGDTVLDSSG